MVVLQLHFHYHFHSLRWQFYNFIFIIIFIPLGGSSTILRYYSWYWYPRSLLYNVEDFYLQDKFMFASQKNVRMLSLLLFAILIPHFFISCTPKKTSFRPCTPPPLQYVFRSTLQESSKYSNLLSLRRTILAPFRNVSRSPRECMHPWQPLFYSKMYFL